MAWGRPAGAGSGGEGQREHQHARPHPWVAAERWEAAGSSLTMQAHGSAAERDGDRAPRWHSGTRAGSLRVQHDTVTVVAAARHKEARMQEHTVAGARLAGHGYAVMAGACSRDTHKDSITYSFAIL